MLSQATLFNKKQTPTPKKPKYGGLLSKALYLIYRFYLYMSMSKTIMIADETYQKLKKMKESKGMSFTRVLESLMEKNNQKKRSEKLLSLKGTWVEDKEEDEKVKEILKGWKKWGKKYA
jgi:predicted CopG family antitoxin